MWLQVQILPRRPQAISVSGSTSDSKSESRGSSPLWSAKKRLDNRVQICDNSLCEVEREKIFDGVPPSVRGVGVARPPREKNFYLLKTKSKLKTVFLNLIERNDMTNKNMVDDGLVLSLMWEMPISTLEELLLEGWNEMSDEDFIELNDIISFKKEWV